MYNKQTVSRPLTASQHARRGRACYTLFIIHCSLTAAVAAPQQPRPNILFIAVDDLRPELGCYGADYIKSPNIDRLASQGMLFARAYCQFAICAASRSSLLTGLRPDTLRTEDNDTHFRDTTPGAVTLPQYFKQNGYTALYFGKIFHRGQEDDENSWSASPPTPALGAEGGGYQLPASREIVRKRRADAIARYGAGNTEGLAGGPAWEAADAPDNAYADGRNTDTALTALRELAAKPQQSFFLAVGYYKPHLPFVAPKKYFDLYAPGSVPLADNAAPPAGAPALARHSSFELRTRAGVPLTGPIDDATAHDLRRAYAACVSFIDAQVGRLLDELDRLGLRDNTIIVLWGDHGWHLGEQGIWGKATNYEAATRAPLIVRALGLEGRPPCRPSVSTSKTDATAAVPPAASHTTRALVEFVDVYPTLCDLAGLPVPARLEGKSFAPLLADPQRPWKSAAFSQFPAPALREWAARPLSDAMRGTLFGPLVTGVEAQLAREHGARYGRELFERHVTGYTMRTDRHRLVTWVDRRAPQGEPLAVELYDHETDPGETRNIAVLPENAALVAHLRAQWLATPSRRRRAKNSRFPRSARPARSVRSILSVLPVLFVLSVLCSPAHADHPRPVDRLQTEARGIHLLWSDGRPEEEQLLALPFIRGGQVVVQWADIEPRPGQYDFSKLDKRLAYFARKNQWCTIQINGNEKPSWLFNAVPRADEKFHHQVRDPKGTLMFWHPRFQAAHIAMLRAAAAHLRASPHRDRLLGIRMNFNAVGTEQFIVPQKYRNPKAWILPPNYKPDDPANASVPPYTDTVRETYATRVVETYKKEFSDWALVLVRNSIDDATLSKLDPDLRAGRLALFHTSSEAEPRTGPIERQYARFQDYARAGHTVAYAEPWASAWGEHGGKIDDRWCSPCQWNYWTLLFNMHCGVSFIGEYYGNLAFALTAKPPRIKTSNPKQQAAEFLAAYKWASPYIGRHNRPDEAPGAWIAFRENHTIKAANGVQSERLKLTRFTGDYTFLMERIGDNGVSNTDDSSKGIAPVGPEDERYGAFARVYPPGKYARLKLDARLLASLAQGRGATARVIYLDDTLDKTATISLHTPAGEHPLGAFPRAATGRWRTANFDLSPAALATASPDWQFAITAGDQPLTLHMLEIIRHP